MVLKIERTDGEDRTQGSDAKKQKVEEQPALTDHPVSEAPPLPPLDAPTPRQRPGKSTCCAGCGVSDGESGPLLLFEDPEEYNSAQKDDGGDEEATKKTEEEEKR